MKRKLAVVLLAVMLLSLMVTGCGKEKKDKPVVTTPLLRIGILSDIHLNADMRHNMYDRFEKALMFYKEKGVDGIVIAGDLQDNREALGAAITAMDELQDIWQRVFPNNINDLTGEYVEPMFIYGNHDKALVESEFWFDNMGSEYEDAWIKEVKGYYFVGAHFTKETGALVQKHLEKAMAGSADQPFFYIQHAPMENTVIGGASAYDGVEIPSQDLLKRSHNCVVLTGHTHVPLTDERAIWQTNSKKEAQYTVVSCGTTHYSYLQDFVELEINGDAHQTQQGIYMVVDGSQVTMERYSFTDMEMTYLEGVASINMEAAQLIGVPWTFDALQTKKRPYDPENRAIKAHQPVFAEDAVLTFAEITSTGAVVTIPPVTVTAPEGYSDVVQSYYVEVVDPTTGEVIKTAEIAAPYHIDDTEERLNQPVSIALTDLTPGTEYTILAYARECFQKASEPLTGQLITALE